MTAITVQTARPRIVESLRTNFRVYAIDGALLGIFMVSACAFVTLLEYPTSPVRRAIDSEFVRRALVGVAMGMTALGLIYSPWGKRSGALMNPAMTLSFLRLGKLNAIDAVFYVSAQFLGATIGVLISSVALGMMVAHRSVNFAATIPGMRGLAAAWLAEFVIALVLINVVMTVNRKPHLSRFTGCFAATLVAIYITFEAPISGMSLNPARTFGSAIFAHEWTGWWIYFTAPILGMFCGIEVQRMISQHQPCGKLTHARNCFVECNCLEGRSQS